MCEFCVKHGEGKKWYLQVKNYLEDVLTDEARQFTLWLYENLESWAAHGWAALDRSDNPDEALRKTFTEMKKMHWGQVIPLEDVEKILDMTLNIVRTPCLCRTALHGVGDARFCFHVVASESDFWKDMFEQWPDVSRELDVLTNEETKREFQKFDRQGLVHTVWSYGPPFIGALCNCSPTDCLSFRSMRFGEQRPFFKAEYVTAIDIEKCNGCRDCIKFCHFGAINYSHASEKCTVNQLQCLGCGLCRTACPRDAITLFDRNAIPVLANEW